MNRGHITRCYLDSLGLQNRHPDFNLLTDIVKRHVAIFAFSSAGCRLGLELPLDLPSLFQRIVVERRGGYCFEHNGLLFEVLNELGYRTTLYLARVVHNRDIHTGLTHRISAVHWENNSYVVDVGFGPLCPAVPVPMDGKNTPDGHRRFRLLEETTGRYHMQVLKDDGYFTLYRFERTCYGQADCDIGHFYSHRHPDARFVNHLVVSLIKKNQIRSLQNLSYQVISQNNTTFQTVSSSSRLHHILVRELGVQVSESEATRLFEDLA